MGVEITPREGAIFGLSGPLKGIVSLCCCVYSKSDHSVLPWVNLGPI